MRLASSIVAWLFAFVSLAALSASTSDCSTCPGSACPFNGELTITAAKCIASLQTDCQSNVSCADGGTSNGAVFPPEDGGTCNVTAAFADGTSSTVQVHWVLKTPKTECCSATFVAEPPSLQIN